MIVLQINPTIDCAGVSWNLCEALNKHTNIECVHIIGEEHPFGFTYGMLFGRDISTERVEELVNQADVLHFNHKDYLEPSFGIDWKKYIGKKKIVYHSHAGWEEGKEYNYLYKLNQLHKRYKSASAVLVCNPANLHIFEDAKWIPNVLLDYWVDIKRDYYEKLKLGHFASNEKYKNVAEMKKLIEEMSKVVDYMLVTNFGDRKRLKELMAKNHILFDNIWQGYFGMTTLEAMQLGVVPITKCVDKSYKTFCEVLGCDNIPIFMVETIEDVKRVIEGFDEDRKFLEDCSNDCRKWINNYYQEKKIVKLWEEFYNGL